MTQGGIAVEQPTEKGTEADCKLRSRFARFTGFSHSCAVAVPPAVVVGRFRNPQSAQRRILELFSAPCL